MSKKIEDVLNPLQIEKLKDMGIDEIKKQLDAKHKESQHWCDCKGCREEREAWKKQVGHPFYGRVEAFRNEVKAATMEKAAKKYKEPFNPKSWSIRELGFHAMAENYDQSNYIVGLMEVAEEKEKTLQQIVGVMLEFGLPLPGSDKETLPEIIREELENNIKLIKELQKENAALRGVPIDY